jgi:signal transduction histidine kinase/HAMP domain-containing protein
MSLRGKLLLAQLPLIAALLAVGVLAIRSVSRLGRSPRTILQDNYRSVLAAQRMKEAARRIQGTATRALAEPDAREPPPSVTLDRGQFDAELRAEEGNITERGEAAVARRLREEWAGYQAALEDHLTHPRDRADPQLESAFLSLTDAANEIVSINEEAMIRKSAQATEEAHGAVRATSATALLAFLIGSLISGLMITGILRPVWLLTRTIAQLGEGNFDVRATVVGDDELAQLTSSVNTMAESLERYRHTSAGRLTLAQQASQAAIDSIPDSVVVFDTRNAVLIANDAARELLWPNKPRSEHLELTAVESTPRAVLARASKHVLMTNTAYAPKGFDEAVRLTTPSGADRYFLPRATAVRGAAGIAGATVIFHDVTSLRLAYELRNDLVATVAHELRTPLTSLRLATHMCLEEAAGPLTERQADLLHTARDACERLQAMVEQLLDLARIQGSGVGLRREPVSPVALVDEAVAAQMAFAKERQVSLRPAVLPGLADVLADRQRVHLVFSNLLTNAIRHAPAQSSVTVAVLPQPTEGLLRFEVSDAGDGIARPLQGALFNRFRQLPGGSPGALGLGLSIAKDVVQAHGGEIGVDSEEGQGSTFWFTIPTVSRGQDEGRGETKSAEAWAKGGKDER